MDFKSIFIFKIKCCC